MARRAVYRVEAPSRLHSEAQAPQQLALAAAAAARASRNQQRQLTAVPEPMAGLMSTNSAPNKGYKNMRHILAACFLAAFSSFALAQSFPVGELKVATPSDVATNRSRIVGIISGASAITPPSMTVVDGNCCGAGVVSYYGQTPATTSWLAWSWGFGGGPYNMVARTHFDTFTGSTCLFVLNGGHGEGFFPPSVTSMINAPLAETQAYVRRIVTTLGCDVILSSMPLTGENYFVIPYIGYADYSQEDVHTYIGTRPQHAPPIGTPLRYFIEPAIGAISYAISQRPVGSPYTKIIVSGLSGGGWTTTLMAAVDPRITHSYAIAGSVPFPNRVVNEGDWEQLAGMAPLGLDYSDLYLMGTIDASGNPSRRVGLLYNGSDACCFKSGSVGGFSTWLKTKAALAGFGPLRIFIDPNKTVHATHSTHVDAILNDIIVSPY